MARRCTPFGSGMNQALGSTSFAGGSSGTGGDWVLESYLD